MCLHGSASTLSSGTPPGSDRTWFCISQSSLSKVSESRVNNDVGNSQSEMPLHKAFPETPAVQTRLDGGKA